MSDPGPITLLLRQTRAGDREAFDQLFSRVYDELHSLARRQLRGGGEGQTLCATVLINEAYLRLIDRSEVGWEDRAHFFGYAARAMRAVLVDHARRRNTKKRGQGQVRISLDDREIPVHDQAELLVAIDEALGRLVEFDERLCRVVECRFFGGMTELETAEALGISERSVRRDWTKARAWLYKELS